MASISKYTITLYKQILNSMNDGTKLRCGIALQHVVTGQLPAWMLCLRCPLLDERALQPDQSPDGRYMLMCMSIMIQLRERLPDMQLCQLDTLRVVVTYLHFSLPLQHCVLQGSELFLDLAVHGMPQTGLDLLPEVVSVNQLRPHSSHQAHNTASLVTCIQMFAS